MATNLEARRQAIAAALRAVMAEPLPPASAPLHPATPAESVTAHHTITASEPPLTPAEPVGLEHPPPLRQALVAGIDWDEADDLAPLAPAEGLDDVESYDDDWEAPSVPPLESAGTMSRAASVALFGHA
jgi:hypothetical protein